MIRISVDTTPLEKVLASMLAKLKDRRPLMRKIAGDLSDAVEENFEKEGRPAWEPLARATVAARGRKGHWPGRILQVSGMLHNSVSSRYDDSSAVVGTNLRYAAIHQFGGTVTRYPQSRLMRTATKKAPARKAHTMGQHTITIPARPFLRLTEADTGHIKETIRIHLEGGK